MTDDHHRTLRLLEQRGVSGEMLLAEMLVSGASADDAQAAIAARKRHQNRLSPAGSGIPACGGSERQSSIDAMAAQISLDPPHLQPINRDGQRCGWIAWDDVSEDYRIIRTDGSPERRAATYEDAKAIALATGSIDTSGATTAAQKGNHHDSNHQDRPVRDDHPQRRN